MSESSAQNRCPSCGAEIPPGAPEGLCPRCVLEEVAQEEAQAGEATRAATEAGMQPPSLEEIAAAFPQFEVLELIGSGGMGAVFKVRQPRLDRVVALKVLPRALAGDERFTERFTREARTLAKLSHPNIVAVHDFGESGGFHYLLMEYVDGANLREAMHAGKFTPEQAFAVVPEICTALQYAHDEGVLHRDIKPENLLLDTKGRVKIADFGIAKLVGREFAGEAPLTRTIAPGTPQYMAPEQIEHPADVDHRADIYSLGVVFYEMLTGELPIGRFAAPSEKAAVGGRVDEIVFRTLEKEPQRRQQSAGEVKTQVEGLDQDAPPAPPVPPARTGGPTASSRRAGRAVLMLLAAAVLFGTAWGGVMLLSQQSRHAERRITHRMEAEIDQLQAEARRLDAVAAAARQDGRPAGEIVEHESMAEQSRARIAVLKNERRTLRDGGPFRGRMMAILVVFCGICLVCGLMALLATIRGWKLLRELRLSGERRGRVPAMIAALLVPVLALSALICVVLVMPARGSWSGPAISLAVIGSVAASLWLILRVRRWLDSPPSDAERNAYQSRVAGEDAAARPARSGMGWVAALVAIVILGPILLIGGCTAIYIWSFRGAEGAAQQDLIAREEAAASEARRVAAAMTVGRDLSSRERELVGSWHFFQGPEGGTFHYGADRRWRLEMANEGVAASGTWRIVNGVLENVIEESNEEGQAGTTQRAEILDLEDDKIVRLKYRESEGDPMVLRPIADLSEAEWKVVGRWQSVEPDDDELFSFFSDRSFEVTTPGGKDSGRWRIDKDRWTFEMIIDETTKVIPKGLVRRGRITKLDDAVFVFENSLGGGQKMLGRLGP
ncbi:MAG: serine/threonine protein kinase [Akkermansiaceae bacterium]|nr:serine/threonine protein kinase [Akkermansiaceae bacterium]